MLLKYGLYCGFIRALMQRGISGILFITGKFIDFFLREKKNIYDQTFLNKGQRIQVEAFN